MKKSLNVFRFVAIFLVVAPCSMVGLSTLDNKRETNVPKKALPDKKSEAGTSCEDTPEKQINAMGQEKFSDTMQQKKGHHCPRSCPWESFSLRECYIMGAVRGIGVALIESWYGSR